MIHMIEFGKLKAMLLDFVDSDSDGCYFLRMVGDEPTVNAIWARLSSRDARGKAWSSGVKILVPGRHYPEHVALMKGVTYKTVRTRLPSGMIDLALIHPRLTVAEDNEYGFFVLSYTDSVPTGFFERLNRTLAIPLQDTWTPWLWELGQQSLQRWFFETKMIRNGNELQEQVQLIEKAFLPITEIKGLGNVRCFSVRTYGGYQDTWLEIVRTQLALGIPLISTTQGYEADQWRILLEDDTHCLYQDDEMLVQAPNLTYALAWAKKELGLNFLVDHELALYIPSKRTHPK